MRYTTQSRVGLECIEFEILQLVKSRYWPSGFAAATADAHVCAIAGDAHEPAAPFPTFNWQSLFEQDLFRCSPPFL